MTISFDLSPDQRQILSSVRDVLSEKAPVSRLRTSSIADNALLPQLAALGWFGLGVEEVCGGAGFDLVEDTLLFVELGRNLLTPSAFAAVVASRLAIAQDNLDLAARIIAGETRICLANVVQAPSRDEIRPAERLSETFLYDAQDAPFALVLSSSSLELVPIEAFADGNERKCTDYTVSLGSARRNETVLAVASAHGAGKMIRRAKLLLSAQLLGIAEAAMETAVGYAKVRQQFGQAIGGFQAVKHRCADMSVRCAALRAQVLLAALSEQEGYGDSELQISAAALLASRYALENAAAGIQIHGAIGFTAECDAHLFLLRAHLLEPIGTSLDDRIFDLAMLAQAGLAGREARE
jgi:alkylation response protein AidB-like acyl-CoA dehydrogenase